LVSFRVHLIFVLIITILLSAPFMIFPVGMQPSAQGNSVDRRWYYNGGWTIDGPTILIIILTEVPIDLLYLHIRTLIIKPQSCPFDGLIALFARSFAPVCMFLFLFVLLWLVLVVLKLLKHNREYIRRLFSVSSVGLTFLVGNLCDTCPEKGGGVGGDAVMDAVFFTCKGK